VSVGDDVLVDGTIAEFRPGNDPVNLTTIEPGSILLNGVPIDPAATAPSVQIVSRRAGTGDAGRARRPDRANRGHR
jgi:hypothetical protein